MGLPVLNINMKGINKIMVIANKKMVMALYTDASDIYSHRVRVALAEKEVAVDIIDVKDNHHAEDIADLNPYGSLPILVDRELVLYQPDIIMEYLDERFPHPPLLPVYPVLRAKYRSMMYRIERDWCSLVRTITDADSHKDALPACKTLLENLMGIAPIFRDTPYFFSDDFTLVDCCIAPILWRLPLFGIKLPKSAAAVVNYAERLFARPAFQASLTELEREMRPQAVGDSR